MKTSYAFPLFLLLTSCAVGPEYHAPGLALPESWRQEQADPKAQVEQQWWQHFHDPLLDQLIARAAKNNFDLAEASARMAEARAIAKSTRGDLLPSVNATSNAERQANRIAFGTATFPKPFNIFQAGFDASWELDLFGGTRRAVEGAKAGMAAAEVDRETIRVAVLAEVARGYLAARQAQAQLALAERTAESRQRSLSLAQERVDAGTRPALEATQAKVELTQAQAQIPVYRDAVVQNAYALDVLLAAEHGSTLGALADAKPIPVPDAAVALTAPASVIAARPDIRAAERRLAAATAEQGVATANLFPKLSLSGFFGLLNGQIGHLAEGGSKSWDVGGGILLPLFNGGKLSAAREAADARQQAALVQYRRTVATALADVERALSAYRSEDERRTMLAQSAIDAAHAAAVAEERYKQGLTTYLEVLDAQRTSYAAAQALAQAAGNAAQNLVALYKALGGGWAEDVAKN